MQIQCLLTWNLKKVGRSLSRYCLMHFMDVWSWEVFYFLEIKRLGLRKQHLQLRQIMVEGKGLRILFSRQKIKI